MKRILFYLFLALFTALSAAAQTDSTRVEVTEESAEESDFSLIESYNYLVRAQVEEKSLLKLGINSFSFLRGSNPVLSVAYEQKLKPELSVLAELKSVIPTSSGWNQSSGLNFGLRYYYNINKRIRNGKSANNFSANYIGLYQQNSIRRYIEQAYYYEPTYQVVFGLQRRLGKYGYVDFFFGPGQRYQKNEQLNFFFGTGISIGLAF